MEWENSSLLKDVSDMKRKHRFGCSIRRVNKSATKKEENQVPSPLAAVNSTGKGVGYYERVEAREEKDLQVKYGLDVWDMM